MSRFTESHIASHRYSRLLASARLLERYLDIRGGRDRISGKFGRWNREALGQSGLAWLCAMERAKMESESTDSRKIAENKETSHPWNALTTVTAFDQGDNMRSTFCLNSINENQSNGKIMPGEQIANATGVLIESLLQQLCTMLEGDEVRRNKLYYAICDKLHELRLINNTYNTMEYEMLRGKYQHALYHMLSVARNETENKSVLSIPRYLMPKLFRYHEEFHEISFIARGGFGEVYKARHRLDGTEYAIKKIVMPANRIEIINQQLNEVRALAKLNHTNIVSYKAAWIEPMLPSSYVSSVPSTDRKYRSSKYHQKESKSSLLSIEDVSNNENCLNLNKSKKYHSKQEILDTKTSSITDTYIDIRMKERNKVYISDDSIINKRFEELNSSVNIIGKRIVQETNIEEYTEESSSDVVSFRNSGNDESIDQAVADTEDTSSYSQEESSRELCMYTSNENRRYVTLYIQMALCEQTLEQWYGEMSVTPEPMVIAIFRQILCGVDYMHSQKIVHHDIKPSNIFISTSRQLQIQLGDFGLACPLQTENHQSVVGTHMYAAPEQLQGKCDPKSDIYSIGIILIELLISIKTKMELTSIVRCLKYGTVPEALKRYKWASIIKELVQEDPAKRPSTSQLLQDFNEDKDKLINGLKDTIVILKSDNRDKDNTIQMLQEEIALLKEKVQKLNMSPDDMIN